MEQALLELALSQYGVFSLEQASKVGVSARTIHRAAAAGQLHRVAPQIYQLAASAASWEGELMSTQLWLGHDSAVSHSSAAALWRFPGFERGPLVLSTSRPKKALPPVVVHKSCGDLNAHTTTVGPLRVINAGRTLVDIAGLQPIESLERAIEDALRRRLTSVGHLQWLLRERYGKGAKGIGILRDLLPAGAVTESDFEIRLFQAIRRASLPLPVRQYRVVDGRREVARVDFAYPWAKVAIEADSYKFHSGRQAWEDDLKRRNALTARGWLVIHVTYRQMQEDLSEVVARIREALMPSLELRKE